MLKKFWRNTKRRWLPYVIAFTGKIAVRLLLRTCRIEINGIEQFIETAKKSPCILMFWHDRIVLISELMNTHAPQFIYTAFISNSRDGDSLALLANSYKCGRALRVPHNARHRALSQMIGQLKDRQNVILITPDGPRGPRYVVKPGIILAAKAAAAKIVPFSWAADRVWKLNTWDRMMIPKPFSKINVFFGDPLSIKKEGNDVLEELRDVLLNAER